VSCDIILNSNGYWETARNAGAPLRSNKKA